MCVCFQRNIKNLIAYNVRTIRTYVQEFCVRFTTAAAETRRNKLSGSGRNVFNSHAARISELKIGYYAVILLPVLLGAAEKSSVIALLIGLGRIERTHESR